MRSAVAIAWIDAVGSAAGERRHRGWPRQCRESGVSSSEASPRSVATARGPRGIIRKTEQAGDLEEIGAEPIVLDIENVEIGDAAAGADAVVSAAGAGPGSGPARKRTVDYGGAVKLVEAAQANDIRRYVMVSAIGANHPERWSDQMRPYYEAKAEADQAVSESGLDYTIVRPGRLTDDPGTGRVRDRGDARDRRLGDPRRRRGGDRRGPGRREHDRQVLRPAGGETPIAEAVRSL